jgi:outer membrane protein insertion porin family
MKKWTSSARILAASIMLAVAFSAQALAADVIRGIKVEGSQRIEPATVLSYIDVQAGDTFDPMAMNRALKALFATGLFADVSLYQEGAELVIVVVENPIINEIRFEGNNEIKKDLLLPEVQLRPRTVLTRTRLQADVDRLQDIYRWTGYFAAKIDPKIIKLDQNRVNLVFEIDEGPETLITRIAFLGNKRFDDSKLQTVVRSQEERWWRLWSGDDKYDPDRLNFDKELLRKFYLENGYADFQVESAMGELSPDRESFYVTYSMSEGERYKIGEVTIKSDVAGLDGETLRKIVAFEKGDWYRASYIERTVLNMTNELNNLQYAFIEVVPGIERKRENHTIDVTFTVRPGKKVFVENINVSGNMRTLDEVIRREMTMVEGDPFNAEQLKKSEQRIKDLDFFEKVEIKQEQGLTPDKTNIDVAVTEKSTGALSIGAGYSTTDGPLGDFRISERNFLGKGQELAFSTTLASERTEFDFSFTEPYFLKRDLSAGFDVFHVTRDNQDESSYDSTRSGGGLRLSYPLSDNVRQGVGYRFESNDIRNVPAGASNFIKAQEGSYITSAISQRITYNTTDSREDPTQGAIVRFDNDLSGLGGDSRYLKTRLGGTYYYPVVDKWILSVVGEGGYVFGYGGKDVRINERFYIGGDSLRGFDNAGIGPRDVTTGDALGGNAFYRGSVQIDFPSGLPEDLGVRLHTFADFGSLWSVDDKGVGIEDAASIRTSAGFGASWRSPMGPIRASFALPITKEEYDEKEHFRFNFGTRF